MEKCEFGKSKVEYLGHVVSAEGISPSRSKMEAIQNAPDPSNVTELKAFLGLLNYYGKFLPNLSSTLQPLYILLKKQQRWKWLDQQRKAFRQAKQTLVKSDLLVHYDLGKPIKLSCDASPYGVGECLSHVMEDGTERPVAFASRTLAPSRRYTVNYPCRCCQQELRQIHRGGSVGFYPVYGWWKEQSAAGVMYSLYCEGGILHIYLPTGSVIA